MRICARPRRYRAGPTQVIDHASLFSRRPARLPSGAARRPWRYSDFRELPMAGRRTLRRAANRISSVSSSPQRKREEPSAVSRRGSRRASHTAATGTTTAAAAASTSQRRAHMIRTWLRHRRSPTAVPRRTGNPALRQREARASVLGKAIDSSKRLIVATANTFTDAGAQRCDFPRRAAEDGSRWTGFADRLPRLAYLGSLPRSVGLESKLGVGAAAVVVFAALLACKSGNKAK